MVKLEVGQSYRLVRDYEIRNEETGTLKHVIRKGEVVKVRKVEAEADHVWLEGVTYPAAYGTLPIHVVPAE